MRSVEIVHRSEVLRICVRWRLSDEKMPPRAAAAADASQSVGVSDYYVNDVSKKRNTSCMCIAFTSNQATLFRKKLKFFRGVKRVQYSAHSHQRYYDDFEMDSADHYI